jgi:predicted metal-dependent peptidase
VSAPIINAPPPPTAAEVEAFRARCGVIKTRLGMFAPFFGHLVLKLELIVVPPDHRIQTAAVTRDRRCFLNYGFCQPLTDAELAFVLCHEVMHCAFLCFERGETRTARVWHPAMGVIGLWNVAHDFAINDVISLMADPTDIKLLPNICHDTQYRDWSAEKIYDKLLQKAEANPAPPPTGPGQPGPGEPVDGTCPRGVPDGAFGIDDVKDDNAASGLGDPSDESGDPSGGSKSLSEAERRELDDYWRVAVCEAAQIHQQKNQGALPGSILKLVNEIEDPKIGWADALSKWVGENGNRADYTYRRPSRRSESVGEYMPSLQRHGVDDIVVLGDTSGSMNGREKEIAAETWGMCEDLGLQIRFIACDTQVNVDRIIEDAEDLEGAFKGGGGSNYVPAFDLLDAEGYEGVVISFSDGYIRVPKAKPPNIRAVMWVLWEHRGDVDPTDGRWGETLRVDKDGNVRK